MKVFLRILAMVFLVLSVQQLVRGLFSGLTGRGYNFAVLGLSDTVIVLLAILLIVLSLFLFRFTASAFEKDG